MSNRAVLSVLGLLSLVLLLPGNTGRAGGEKDDAERVKAVRATYKTTSPTILGVREPVKMEGHALGIFPKFIRVGFIDADGKNCHCIWWLEDGVSPINNRFDFVRSKGGKKELLHLPLRGPEEAALYGLLLRWSPANEKLEKASREYVNQMLEKFDQRFGAGQKPVVNNDTVWTLDNQIKALKAEIEQAERELSDAKKRMNALLKERKERAPKK